MPGYRAEPSRPDKAKAIGGVALIYAVMVGAALLMPADSPLRTGEIQPTVLIDVKQLPEPEPPPPEEPGKAEEEEGAAGKKAEPTPVVAPKPKIIVPAKPPVAAAPVAGTGSATTAGASTHGTGPGAGGSGTGRGGGGGGGGGGLVSGPRLVSGGPVRADYRRLGARTAGPTRAILRLTVAADGRVQNCDIVASTGYPDLDRRICPYFQARMRWNPARRRDGQAETSWVDFVVTLTPN